jgi:hypothetical protein
MSKMKEIATTALDCGLRGMTSERTFTELRKEYPSFMATATDGDLDALYDFWLNGYADSPEDSMYEPEDRF